MKRSSCYLSVANLESLETRRLLSAANAGLTTIGDVNADGRADSVSVESAATGAQGRFRVTTSLGNGHGGFGATTVRELSMVRPIAAVAGDLLFDGSVDPIIISPQTAATGSPLVAHIDLTFQGNIYHFQSLMFGSNGLGVTDGSWAFGSVTNDNAGDLVRLDGSGMIHVFRNSGCFTFDVGVSQSFVFTGGNARQLSLGDFDNDGFGDMAAITNSGVQVATTLAGGPCTPPVTLSVGRGTPTTLAAADANGDGRDDLIAGFADGSVRTLLQNANGTFNAPIHSSGAIAATAVRLHAGDVDGDGDADLFANKASVVTEFAMARGNGQGTFSSLAIGKVREMTVLENNPLGSPQGVLS